MCLDLQEAWRLRSGDEGAEEDRSRQDLGRRPRVTLLASTTMKSGPKARVAWWSSTRQVNSLAKHSERGSGSGSPNCWSHHAQRPFVRRTSSADRMAVQRLRQPGPRRRTCHRRQHGMVLRAQRARRPGLLPSPARRPDITAVRWSDIEPVGVLCGGFPCHDVSTVSQGTGLAPGTGSGRWSCMPPRSKHCDPGSG